MIGLFSVEFMEITNNTVICSQLLIIITFKLRQAEFWVQVK